MDDGSSAAVTWLLSVGAGGFALLCVVALIHEKGRRKFEHPQLGRLTYEWGSWTGTFSHYKSDRAPVRFQLPGPKSGPEGQSCDELMEFWRKVEDKVKQAREAAVEEFRELEDAYEGAEEERLVEQISSDLEKDLGEIEKHWWLVGLARAEHDSYRWALEFEVAWDPEHTRSAYFDSQGELCAYDLSCAEPWDEEG